MKMEYKRELEKSYMIIRREKKDWEDFEIQMFLNNRIKGMLPFFFLMEDGKAKFMYDITGKQPLELFLRRKGFRTEMFQKLLHSLRQVQQSIADYLLDENALVLDKEAVYVDYKGEEFSFCYLPGYVHPLEQSFQSLLEVLMAEAAPEEGRLLDDMHKIHQNILAGQFSLAECEAVFAKEEVEKEPSFEAEEDAEEEFDPGLEEEKEYGMPMDHIKERIAHSWQTLSKKGEGNKKEERPAHSWQTLSKKGDSYKKEKKKPPLWRKTREDPDYENYQVSYEPDLGMVEEQYVYPTVYIGGDRTAFAGRFESKNPETYGNFTLPGDDVLIGKQAEEVDVCLNDESVSRFHAVVQKTGEDYFLEDLNSMNGTFVNQKRIPYREKVLLHPGDEVVFGRAEYIFR